MSCLDRTRAGELFELYEEDVIRKELYPIFVKLARHVPRISRCRAGDPVRTITGIASWVRTLTVAVAPGTLWRTITCIASWVRTLTVAVAPGTLWRTISQRLCGAAFLKE